MEKYRLSPGVPDYTFNRCCLIFVLQKKLRILAVRKRLELELAEKGAAVVCMKNLLRLDPDALKKFIRIIIVRLVRALEIIEVTGKTKGDHEEEQDTLLFMIISLLVLKWTVTCYMNGLVNVWTS